MRKWVVTGNDRRNLFTLAMSFPRSAQGEANNVKPYRSGIKRLTNGPRMQIITPKQNQTEASTAELIAHWRKPAPLLGLLHALHDRDGYLSDESLRTVSKLANPLADLRNLYVYHHFARNHRARERRAFAPAIWSGGAATCSTLDDAREMPCAGRTITIPVLVRQQVFTATPDYAHPHSFTASFHKSQRI